MRIRYSIILERTVVVVLIFSWVFNYPPINFGGQGWPMLWDNPRFPPAIEEAMAGDVTYTISDGSLTAATVSGGCDTSLTNTTASDGAQGTVITSTCVGRNDNPVVKWTKTVSWETMGVPSGAEVTQVNGSFMYRVAQETHAATQTIGTMTLRDSGDTAACAASDLEANFDPGAVNANFSTSDSVGAIAVSAGCETSSTSVTIRLDVNPRTGNNASATSELRADDIKLVITYNIPPSLSVSQPDGTGDTVTVGDSYNVTYTLADTDNVVTAAFSYDTNNSGLDGTAISGTCASAAEGTDVTCTWDTTGVTPGSYYVYGITNDGVNPQVSAYSSGQITINAPPGSLTLTASSSNSFNAALTYIFTSQTATMSDLGALQVSDDRGGSPGWTLSMASQDWAEANNGAPGGHHNQLDYDGTGSDGNLGKMCSFPNNANLYAESGSLTGVTKQPNLCFSASVTSIPLVIATAGNGTGVYWLTDLALEQFFPSSPTVQVYTTTVVLTAS